MNGGKIYTNSDGFVGLRRHAQKVVEAVGGTPQISLSECSLAVILA